MGKLLKLRMGCAQKVPGVGVIGINFGDFAESVDRSLRITVVLVQQSQVVPDVRIFGIGLGCFFKDFFGFFHFAGIYKGNAFVDASHRQLRVQFNCLAKRLQTLFEKLLIHVGRTQVVEACGRAGLIVGGRGGCGFRRGCESA